MEKITEAERTKRKKEIDFARGSVRLEGIILDKETEELNQRYINGDIESEQHSRLCREHMIKKYGKKQ